MMSKKRQAWFNKRIGKRVFESRLYCSCSKCKEQFENGIIIEDQRIANILFDYEEMSLITGMPLVYLDKKWPEAQNYEKD